MRLLIMLAVLTALTTGVVWGLTPQVTDPGFENGTAGWEWQVRGSAAVTYSLDKTNPHSGKQCLVFKNNSGFAENVYGRLFFDVNVLPSTKYELSCWVRGEDVSGEVGATHITDWGTYMLSVPTGTFDWKKISVEFKTRPDQTFITVGINVVNKCKALAFDDISLRALDGQVKGDGTIGVVFADPKVIGHDTKASLCVILESSKKIAAVETTVTTGGKKVAHKSKPVKDGQSRVDLEWNTGNHPFGSYDCQIQVLGDGGKVLASGSTKVEVVDSPVFGDMEKIEARKKEFYSLYKQCKAKGIRLDYPTVTKTMLEQFVPFLGYDVRYGAEWRAKNCVIDFNRSLDESIAFMKACLENPDLAPVVKRYQTSKVKINDLSFIGDRIDSNGKKDNGPVFFNGYGHFIQVRKDLPKFPDYGVNIIQIEIGPSAVLPYENTVNMEAVKEIANQLDRAARHNVKINLLLSQHYWPGWAIEKWPHLAKAGGGFLNYCVDDPAAKQITEKFLRAVIPVIKDNPALHSICLSNEPVFNNTVNADNTKDLWIEYLKHMHKDIDTLNKRYETSYKSFADVPYNGDPNAYDWTMFCHQRFANWHKWMADIIHEMAPDIATHSKVMSNQMWPGEAVNWSANQELFGNYLDINGNDCHWFGGNETWPIDPWHQNANYDLQRSYARKPIFNSENHISMDGNTNHMAPENFRSCLWQGAIHGQSATTIWVWERMVPGEAWSYPFTGNIMDRPGCAEIVGKTCLDLNRFSEEVAAIQSAKAPVAIVYAMSSIIRRGNEHVNAIWPVYHCLTFSGLKVDFISERQLKAGKGKNYKAIIVPEAETISDDAFYAISALPSSTRLFFLRECFTRNEYGKKRPAYEVKSVLDKGTTLPSGETDKVLLPAIKKELASLGALPEYTVVDAATGEPIWGVEWLPAKVNGRTVINIINFISKPFEAKILENGKEVGARDLLSLGGREKVRTLKTLTPVLAEVEE